MEHIRIPKIENVKLLDKFNPRVSSLGTLYLTATHLIFVEPGNKKEIWILHMHICNVEKLPLTTAGSPLLVRCKNFQCVTFMIQKDRSCNDVYLSLLKLSQPAQLEDLYAFNYTPSNNGLKKSSGWYDFKLSEEFARMGVSNQKWCRTSVNNKYEICDTYPRELYVPASVSTHILIGSSKFRSRGRLPTLSYLHKENMAAICRCSQPLAGFSARCLEDEQMLQEILKANPNSSFMYIIDTRPRINAVANKATGKGYENTDFYSNMCFKFFGIENIHVMRNSLNKLIEACELKNPTMTDFLKGLESSGWLKHIKMVLDTSIFIANAIYREKVSVLVHCSDGWDRTAQTCSLAGIILDPYYRTIRGFQCLIEKEWLAFGHKFMDRCGHVAVDPREVSPVFTQFIDCTWQLSQMFPCAFQFNERFLLTLHDHVFSSQFGTFLGNCQRERRKARLSENTYSLWGYMKGKMADYVNPLYLQSHPASRGYIHVDTRPQNVRFWAGMYNRFDNGVHPRESINDTLSAIKDHTSSLEDYIHFMEKHLRELKKQLGHSNCTEDDKDHCLPDNHQDDRPKRAGARGGSGGSGGQGWAAGATGPNPSLDSSGAGGGVEDSIGSSGSMEMPSDAESGIDLTTPNHDEGEGKGGVSGSSAGVEGGDSMSVEEVCRVLDSLVLDWQTFKNFRSCSCGTIFNHSSRKYHCWKCGGVFCVQCVDRQSPLPAHYSQRPVPVCKPCYQHLNSAYLIPEPSRS